MKISTLLLSVAVFTATSFSATIAAKAANGYQPVTSRLCVTAAALEERAHHIPDALLQALSLAESGRRDPATRKMVAWPWTVMAEGEGRYYPTKEHAVKAVKEIQARGVRNIDVGCMQINLMHHADAFANLEMAFEPARNVAYAAQYLSALHHETNSWFTAVKRYHSARPRHHLPYRGRVFRIWRNVKRETLAARAIHQATVIDLDTNSESMSVDIDIRPTTFDGTSPPIILETLRSRWRGAYDRAQAALSLYNRRAIDQKSRP